MKWIAMLAVCSFLTVTVTTAQINNEDIQQELERATEEMRRELDQLDLAKLPIDSLMGAAFSTLDTLGLAAFFPFKKIDTKEFTDELEHQLSEFPLEEMMETMTRQIQQVDFAELEKLLKNAFPQLPENEMTPRKNSGNSTKSSGSKTYRLK